MHHEASMQYKRIRDTTCTQVSSYSTANVQEYPIYSVQSKERGIILNPFKRHPVRNPSFVHSNNELHMDMK